MIKIIAVGKKFDKNLSSAIAEYEKRLRAPFSVEWLLLPYSAKEDDMARQEESQTIMTHLKDNDYVILLDERGQLLTSPQFSAKLSSHTNATIVIGGAYGVDKIMMKRANDVVSLSHMVFPHQLVRLILIEQIYRAQAIYYHHPYHHE